jgi:branched-chain amino acid transport system substrate-binding protein
MKKIWLPLIPLLIIALLFTVVGCGGGGTTATPTATKTAAPTPTQVQTQTLKIGATCPMSGSLAWCGQNIVAGLTFAAQDINKAGGIKVGNDIYMLDIVYYDDQYNSDQAAANIRRLMDQGIKFIAGQSDVQTNAGTPITEPAKIILFAGPNSINAQNTYMFRTNATPTGLATKLTLKYVKDTYPTLTKLAILNNDSQSGKVVTQEEAATAQSLGFEVVFSQLYALDTTDFNPYLAKVVATHPDIIDTGASSPAGGIANLARILNELGWQGKINASLGGPSFAPGASGLAAMNGVFGFMPQDPNSKFATPKEQELKARFAQMYPSSNVMDYTFSFYEALDGLAQAITKAGTIDTTAVRDTWTNLTWQSVRGTFSFSGEQTFGIKHSIVGPISFGTVIDGKVVEQQRYWPVYP